MKRIILLAFVVIFAGCASIEVPNYIKDENPYKKTFYAGYGDVLTAVKITLKDMRWEITGESHPSVYEIQEETSQTGESQETMLFTKTHIFQFFIGTSYSKVNVYVRGIDKNSTDVEIRYIKVTSILFNNFKNYKKDKLADKFFDKVGAKLVK